MRRPLPSANIAPVVHDLIIVGAGPVGISTALEAREAGIGRERILMLEKGPAHSYGIRKFCPEDKRLDAVYKGIPDHSTLGAERPIRRRVAGPSASTMTGSGST